MKITKWMILAVANGQLGKFFNIFESGISNDRKIRSFFDNLKDDRTLTIENW